MSGQGRPRRGSSDGLTPEGVWELRHEPLLRFGDRPELHAVFDHLAVLPQDSHLQEVLGFAVQEQATRALEAGDPFWASYPPRGALPRPTPGVVPLCALPTGDVLSLPTDALRRNCIVTGATGGGKTSLLRLMLLALQATDARVVAFDRKPGELVDCAALAQRGLDVLVLHWRELMLSLLQPPPGMPLHAFVNVFVELLARHQSLFASRRLLTETLHLLFARHRGAGYPLLTEWLALLERINASAASRLGQYREAGLYALKEIHYAFGTVLAYRASDVLERLTTRRGLTVIVTEGLSASMASVLASLFINWAFEARGRAPSGELLVFVLDDALPLIREGASGESEGGDNPVSTWAFMGRSRGIGLVVSSQCYSAVSSALRSNAATVLCCGSYGRDARELALDLHLTREQAGVLPRLQPGEVVACVRPVWPSAVYGRVPLVQ